MKDTIRKSLKARRDALAADLDDVNQQIDVMQAGLAEQKTRRDAIKAERDQIQADLDAEPEAP